MKFTPSILKHMDHLEDLLYYGVPGINMASKALSSVASMVKKGEAIPSISTKMDGAPAFVAATDFNGEKFIALKHSWDKGKRFHSKDEIVAEYGERESLCHKLIALFTKLDFIGIPKDEIWMGDYLFSNEDLRNTAINGEDYITFKPNTLVYAIPADSTSAREILNSEIGIVWHTKYTGKSYDSLEMSFGAKTSELNSVPGVYQIDPSISIKPNAVTTIDESILSSMEFHMNEALKELAEDTRLSLITESKKLVGIMLEHTNDSIKTRDDETFTVDSLIEFYKNKETNRIGNLKTEAGKIKALDKMNAIIDSIKSIEEIIEKFYKAQKCCVDMKNYLVSILDRSSHLKTYYQSLTSGYIPCGGEGYVVFDEYGNNAKLVARISFSRANQDKNIIKGWSK